MIVTLQIQIESQNDFSKEDLDNIEGEINICCTQLEKLKIGGPVISFLRNAMFIDGQLYQRFGKR